MAAWSAILVKATTDVCAFRMFGVCAMRFAKRIDAVRFGCCTGSALVRLTGRCMVGAYRSAIRHDATSRNHRKRKTTNSLFIPSNLPGRPRLPPRPIHHPLQLLSLPVPPDNRHQRILHLPPHLRASRTDIVLFPVEEVVEGSGGCEDDGCEEEG